MIRTLLNMFHASGDGVHYSAYVTFQEWNAAMEKLTGMEAEIRYQSSLWRNVFDKVKALYLTGTTVQVASLWKFMKDAEDGPPKEHSN